MTTFKHDRESEGRTRSFSMWYATGLLGGSFGTMSLYHVIHVCQIPHTSLPQNIQTTGQFRNLLTFIWSQSFSSNQCELVAKSRMYPGTDGKLENMDVLYCACLLVLAFCRRGMYVRGEYLLKR